MEIQYLAEFIRLAETCSYVEAADQLYISQSSLTKHIQRLEKELGVPLFDRSTRSVRLSSYGKDFLPYAKAICASYQKGLDKLSHQMDRNQNTLRIAAIPPMSAYGIPELIQQFEKKYPQCTLHLYQETSETIWKMIADHRCDIAFAHDVSNELPEGFEAVTYTRDYIVAAISSDNPLSARKSISLDELTRAGELYSRSNYVEAAVRTQMHTSRSLQIADSHLGGDAIIDIIHDRNKFYLLMNRPARADLRRSRNKGVSLVAIRPKVYSTILLLYASGGQNEYVQNFLQLVFPDRA